MPAEIPGYYFDDSKNRYFKIQANHVARGLSSAAPSKYSRQAVNAEKVIKKAKQRERHLKESRADVTVRRSPLSAHPFLDFGWRLGDHRKNAAAIVKNYYSTSVSGSEIPIGPRSPCGHFAIEPSTGYLLTATSAKAGQRTSVMTIVKPIDTPNNESRTSVQQSGRNDYELVPQSQFSNIISGVVSLNNGLSAWLGISPADDESGLTLAYHSPGSEDRLIGMQFTFSSILRGIAKSPSGSSIAMPSDQKAIYMSHMDTPQPAMQSLPIEEQTCVHFKDENVLMFGARDGILTLCDIRAPNSKVMRLQNSHGITHVRSIDPAGHQILVNGFAGVKIYDLRYCPLPTVSSPTVRPRKKLWRSQIRETLPSMSLPFACSPWTVMFNVPPTRRQNAFHLGFAYDRELKIVASASTDHHANNRMGLWDAVTGRMLQSPLNDMVFKSPVTCAEFSDADAHLEGKTLFLAEGPRLWKWSIK